MRICPITDRFINFVRVFNRNPSRAGFYAVMAIIQYCSCICMVTSLLACAIVLTLAAICYLLAAVKNQEFTESATLGGAGIARQIL